MVGEALKLEIPKLPELDKEDVRAIRSFLPGKLLGRTAALLSIVLLVLGFAIAVKIGLSQFLGVDLGLPAVGILIGLLFFTVAAQIVLEWRAERNRAALLALAVKVGTEQTGYFRIGPYQDTAEDRAKFSRPDRAEQKVMDWLKKSAQTSLYLTGDSGSGKSSLLNAFVLPELREAGWTVVEARAWQDPQAALRNTLAKMQSTRRTKAGEDRTLREIVEEATKRASDRLLIVLDQFEEFVILGKPERHQEFSTFVAELQTRPVKGLTLLLVLRSDYQMLLEEIGLPLPRSGENLFQVGRFQISAANAFMRQSGLDLQPEALDRLVSSAAEMDDTPGLVRPITLNVIGYVLASGKATAPSLDAGSLVRQYIEQTLQQPEIRDRAPRMLEQMITEQGTKQPRLEQELAVKAEFRLAEVRAVLNSLCDAGLARPLNPAQGVWELSHDFIARAVARFLGRSRKQLQRRAVAYTAPALLAVSLLGAAGVAAWNRFGPDHIRSQLADLGIVTKADKDGMAASATSSLNDEELSKIVPLLGSLLVRSLNLSGTQVTSVEPLKGLTALQGLNLSRTRVKSVEALKGLTALQTLDLSQTQVISVEPLKGLAALQWLYLSQTQVTSVEPLKGLTALQTLDLSRTPVASVEPLKGLTALQGLDLSGTQITSVEALKGLIALQSLNLAITPVTHIESLRGLTALQALNVWGTPVISVEALKDLTRLQILTLSRTPVTSIEALKGLAALQELDLSGTPVTNVEPLKGLTALQWLNLSGTPITNVEPLKGLTALHDLYLAQTQITSVEPLKGLTALHDLYLAGTQVTSVEPLKRLTTLETLYLAGTPVTSVEPLKGLTALQTLYLSQTQITSVEALKGLIALQTLDLAGTPVTSVEPLKGLTALQTLYLSGTQATSVEALNGLTALQWLNLALAPVTSVEALMGLTALEVLSLSQTQVTSVEPLKGVTRLQWLNLSRTQVTSVEALMGVTRLQHLDLAATQVKSVEALKGLTVLQTLNLSQTQVISVEALKGLIALQWLNLSQTQVTSVEPLKGLTALQELDLSGTPVTGVEALNGLGTLRLKGP